MMYPIIIADIAPMIPGGLTHFNWPRSLRDKPQYRVYHKTYHKSVTIRVRMSATGKHGRCHIFVRISYVEEVTYNRVGT